ncbi:hypothetical protein CPLU01_00235 [Colletotrichum plurivorum]|uniref:Uncharacterized protein n=1 Tax=Colletotrichum plurivorum TaxID=2175906 RepID=A0A8H6NT54_9PEZI|nr:hypothetical protein CPLU01_00235 [Colletotrichum plurivorum]
MDTYEIYEPGWFDCERDATRMTLLTSPPSESDSEVSITGPTDPEPTGNGSDSNDDDVTPFSFLSHPRLSDNNGRREQERRSREIKEKEKRPTAPGETRS